ncbi:MAG: diphthine synthase [uncultured archaeon A07HN63]|nr:MAG: diphthine synthase [uncultured archaeon A07HN63]
MLTFIGLGLYDEHSITREGETALRDADRVFAEFYTSRLLGASVEELETHHDIEIEVRDRAGVEQDPEPMLAAAAEGDVAFLTAGDTMISTTHADLRVRAAERGIDTRVVHGVTAETAASGLTGLQNYRFGKAVTLPFPAVHGAGDVPPSVIESIDANRERGLHTLVYLDIKIDTHAEMSVDDPFMRASEAAALLAESWGDELGIVVARAGSPEPVVAADRLSALADQSFGEPLHLLVIPGDLHHVEADALESLAGAPPALLSDEV